MTTFFIIFFAALFVLYICLRKAIYKHNITRIESGNHVCIEIRGKDGSLLYEFSAE